MNSSKKKVTPLRLISPLHRANRQAAIFLEQETVDLGVSAPEAHLVSYVDAYGPCPVGELVRVFGYKKPTMTGMLDRLEKKGLVVRELNPKDRRSFMVTTSRTGGALGREARKRVERFEERLLARVSERDWKGFLGVMQAVAEVTGVEVRKNGKESRSHG